jgi:hypothetical protein
MAKLPFLHFSNAGTLERTAGKTLALAVSQVMAPSGGSGTGLPRAHR